MAYNSLSNVQLNCTEFSDFKNQTLTLLYISKSLIAKKKHTIERNIFV